MKTINNTIQEDFCSFEVSKLLKEKGFDCVTTEYYNTNSLVVAQGVYKNYYVTRPLWFRNTHKPISLNDFECTRPTHALAIKWIRENFGIMIWVDIFKISSFHGWAWNILAYKEGKCIANKEQQADSVHMTPQEATEAALLYTLTNLIK